MSCGADVTANELMTALLAGKNFTVPDVQLNADSLKLPLDANADMYAAIKRLDMAEFTTGSTTGTGAFDVLMSSVRVHLKQEYEGGRITGAEYTKAYAALTTSTMSSALQFLLGKDQAYWASQQAQINAITAMLQMETERVRLAALKFDALSSEANYAITKIKLANEDAQYCINKFNLENLLPAQKSLLDGQVIAQTTNNSKSQFELVTLLPKQAEGLTLANLGKTTENAAATFSLANILPKQADMLTAQVAGQQTQNSQALYTLNSLMPAQLEKLETEIESVSVGTDVTRYNLSTLLPLQNLTGRFTLEQMMPSQKAMLNSQKAGQDIANLSATYTKDFTLPQQYKLLQEQTETQRAQTLDTRTDGVTAVVGYVGKQKDLYSQQIDSYKRDAEIKAAKLVSDGWMTQKTIDEAALTPSSFQQNMVDAVLQVVKQRNGLS